MEAHTETRLLEGEEEIVGKGSVVFRIREARVEDMQQIIRINRAVLPENYPEFFFHEHLRHFPKAFIVAVLKGNVVGYVMSRVEYGWSLISKGLPLRKGHIISVGVLPEARRVGIAYNMLLRAFRTLKYVYGASEVYLEVRVSNEPAISLYRKLGMEVISVVPRYYSDGEDAYIMARQLGDGL